jgi:hypothetical protein
MPSVEVSIMRVMCYFNLHKMVWSVKALEGEHRGRVIGHAKRVTLNNVTQRVSEAGRQRVIREKKKNVHAGMVGTLAAVSKDGLEKLGPYCQADFDCDQKTLDSHPRSLYYNPYKTPRFVFSGTTEEFEYAPTVLMNSDGRLVTAFV